MPRGSVYITKIKFNVKYTIIEHNRMVHSNVREDLVEWYFNYFPEAKSVTDRHEDPYIPPTLVKRGYKNW